MKPKVLFLVGPTASGKSKLAMEVARRLKGEIISADSMQVYRGMDIGTAKPSKTERKRIPHHLIDIISPSQSFSAYQYRRLALGKIKEILCRGKFPIVVGGSGLYVRALLEGFSGHPGADARLRKKLALEAKSKGVKALYQLLKKWDSAVASKIAPSDTKRIIRALEIFEQSGKKASEWYERRETLEDAGFVPVVIGITRDRKELYEVINRRVEAMVRRGLFREVGVLAKKRLSQTASQAVGYKEILGAMQAGEPPALSLEVVKRNTRRLAKRQWTWFKRERGIEWILWSSQESVKTMAEKVLENIRHAAG